MRDQVRTYRGYLLVQKAAVPCAENADVLWPLVLNLGELLEDRLYRILLFHHLENSTNSTNISSSKIRH